MQPAASIRTIEPARCIGLVDEILDAAGRLVQERMDTYGFNDVIEEAPPEFMVLFEEEFGDNPTGATPMSGNPET